MEKENTLNGKTKAEAEDTLGALHSPSHVYGDGAHEDSKSIADAELAEPEPPQHRKDILKALEAVERDSAAIADSFSSLFTSLRLSLSQVAKIYYTFNSFWYHSVTSISFLFLDFGPTNFEFEVSHFVSILG